LALASTTWTSVAAAAAPANVELPASPYAIMGSDLLDPPQLDAIAVCVPTRLSMGLGDFEKSIGLRDYEAAQQELDVFAETIAIQDPEERARDLALVRAVLAARQASNRSERLAANGLLEAITRQDRDSERLGCALAESARLLIAMGRLSEAVAANRRITKAFGWQGDDHRLMLAARFYGAEILYRRGDDFDAHLAYREIAGSKHPRIAAAARLRLTDLSFDAGKSRSVQLEYEALLPHGQAFGARMVDWALRASEAALDAGDFAGARAWFELHSEKTEEREARDVVQLRLADLDALQGRPVEAYKRLRSLFGRKGRPDIEALARVRSIDLGVASISPEERIAQLHDATATPNRRVGVYALSVLVHELLLLGQLDAGVAALTRLAYEGADPVLAPHFQSDITALLDRIRIDSGDQPGCRRMIRRLGGRYGVLLDHASDVDPFLALGRCFEILNFHDMAVTLYRDLTRTFGRSIAPKVSLSLARTSLLSGEPGMARAAAEVNLRHGDVDTEAWRALMARAEAALGHSDEARALLRDLLRGGLGPDSRVELVALFASLLDGRPYDEDTRLLTRQLEAIPEAERKRFESTFAEANMKTAQILRRQGRLESAIGFYRVAARHLEEGSRKNEALFWTRAPAIDAAPEDEDQTRTWSRLAAYDQTAREMSAKHSLPGGRE